MLAYLAPGAAVPASVTVFSREGCPHCVRAKGMLRESGIEFQELVLNRDYSQPYRANNSVAAAWAQVYRDTETYWDLYALAEKLVDCEDWFQQWRFRHLTTVSRIIGGRRGTGGTAGVGYLRRAIDLRFFPELWEVRTRL